MAPEEAHQMAGLGYTEEERFADYLKRAREIELKTAAMNEVRRQRDDLQRLQGDEEKAVKAWLKLQADGRKAITIATDDGELEIGAMVKRDEREVVEVYMGGFKLAKAVAKEALGDPDFLATGAFPEKKPRGRPRKDAGEPPAEDPAPADPLSANGRGKAGRPGWQPPAEPKDEAFEKAWAAADPENAIETTAVPAEEPASLTDRLKTEGETLEEARARNAARRKAAAASMREAQNQQPGAPA